MLLLARITNAGPVARAVARHLELDDVPRWRTRAGNPEFRAAIDGELSAELVERAASELGMTEEDAHERIVALSRGHPGAAAGGSRHRCLPCAGVGGTASRQLRGLGPVAPWPCCP